MSIFSLYPLLRPLAFRLDAERAHELGIGALAFAGSTPGLRQMVSQSVPAIPTNVMDIDFPNPLGLAAGLDKHATAIPAFSAMGFGFVEVGTVTPRPQPGNPKPRLFRLVEHEAIINRMGFNSPGLDVVLANVERLHVDAIIGINIGKNAVTPMENAVDDYLIGLQRAYPLADYIAVNISSPNTKNLRELQQEDQLDGLLAALKQEQGLLAEQHDRYVPIALKIAPDLETEQVVVIAELLKRHRFEAVIATNTTISRPQAVSSHPLSNETGGLSGRPEAALSTGIIRQLYKELKGEIPIIGVGGISNAEDAWEKMQAGADLIQLYSALIFQGPVVIKQILDGLQEKIRLSGTTSLRAALGLARKHGTNDE